MATLKYGGNPYDVQRIDDHLRSSSVPFPGCRDDHEVVVAYSLVTSLALTWEFGVVVVLEMILV